MSKYPRLCLGLVVWALVVSLIVVGYQALMRHADAHPWERPKQLRKQAGGEHWP